MTLFAVVACLEGPAPFATDGDLTPTALWVEQELLAGRVPRLQALPAGPPPPFQVPQTLRVWRRSQGGSGSCDGVVEVVELDEYIRHVVPHEWYASWHEESLRSGAIASRSYASWWVNAGGKYDCADVDDTSATQNYGESTDSRTDAAVAYTSGMFAMKDGEVVFAEYSAENGDPTEYGVSEPHCTGEARKGHGRGLCQWGSQRWATNDGRDFEWIIGHYYPGATVLFPLQSRLGATPGPLELVEGAAVEVELVWTNEGSATWDGQVRLETWPKDRASALFDPDTWLAPQHPGSFGGQAALGDSARFTLWLVAPQVQEDTVFSETFTLWSGAHGEWVDEGQLAELTVTVLDASVPGETGRDSLPQVHNGFPGQRVPLTGQGCSHAPGAMSLAGLLLLIRRRSR